MPTILTLAAARTRVRGAAWQPDLTLAYGPHPLQQLDFFGAGGPGQKPLLIFVHGGAWQFGDKARRLADRKIPFAHGEGWHFASLNFRMVPEVGIPAMAGDIAAAIRLLIDRAADLAIDPRCVVLMGHSSGAHLAALVGTAPCYLQAVGLAPESLAGIIANDGAAYDRHLPSLRWNWLQRRLVAPAFSAFSHGHAIAPALHGASGPNARAFLILSTARFHAVSQAQSLHRALLSAGTKSRHHSFPGRGASAHVAMSGKFGLPGFVPTECTRAWLREVQSRC